MKVLAVCVPTQDMVHTWFAHDLTLALAHFLHRPDYNIKLIWRKGTVLARTREEITQEALANPDVTHLLWLDTDMRFPSDLITRLMEHDKEFVAANCSKRVRPAVPTAIKLVDGKSKRVFPDEEKHGLEQVEGIGSAVCLIKREVYEKLERPWYATPWREDGATGELAMVGEDMYLCGLCYNAGIPIYIDHDISWQIGHIGEHEYTMEDVLKDRTDLSDKMRDLNIVAL